MTDDSTVDDTFAEFLNFGAGVLSLVFLSCSVIWGLLAQDRIVLDTRQRILAQAVHRTTAVASVVFLLVHIGVKLALDHTTWVAAVLPFGLLATDDESFGGRAVLIGFGTLASMLMIFVGVTGALRNRFASPAPVAARWRAMHMLAYPAWCLALVHGLYAGRAAKPVFTILYGLSVLGVMAALALRAAPRPVKRRVADRITGLLGTGERPVREEAAQSRGRGRGRAKEAGALPGYERTGGSIPPPRQAPLYESAERLTTPEPANGFAAAYRAVSGPPGTGHPPLTAEAPASPPLPSDLSPTQAMPFADGGNSTSGSWPIPSPPPVGEAPQSVYDPLNDTGHTIPVYGSTDATGQASGYGSSDVYDTRETNAVYDTYYPTDTYNSGPTPEPPPGAPSPSYDFDAPGSGEPWNTPSGGFK
ncbi:MULTISPECIES: cytochrome b/b6 domain-containing protein [Streptomyces]|uniref:cytochrome b/b6 domain-containing protein n=1 Tax=Streptomyces TaxID=1883 RepID=UPI001CCA5E7A|nr:MULTISPECIES: cytochrome b/b6 domain-containing protein [Streptomyces]MBZ6174650.1 cytochrome b/b6 domain-containing protein [Streptomyces olivaceus]MBZ6181056.1 cytochrome b/b6 domain-containing protein [Streptomyces olivaceus]MCM8552893.1 cytochrome b/b6 domain-containing protein [Streptomyces sp. STCH 565 A]